MQDFTPLSGFDLSRIATADKQGPTNTPRESSPALEWVDPYRLSPQAETQELRIVDPKDLIRDSRTITKGMRQCRDATDVDEMEVAEGSCLDWKGLLGARLTITLGGPKR